MSWWLLKPGAGPADSASNGDQSMRLRRAAGLGLLALAAYCLFLYSFHLPSVHFFIDSSGIRDAGTVMTVLSRHGGSNLFWLTTIFLHVEGPLQWLILNLWQHAVGDLVPLNPTTTYFPQAVFAFLAGLYAYLLGSKLHSRRLGWLMAALLLFSPWLAICMRRGSLFMTTSCALEFVTLYYFLGFSREPQRRLYRIMAPLALFLYLGSGLDWPSFIFTLLLFVLFSGSWRQVLRNPYMLIPVGFFLGMALFSLVLYQKGIYWESTVVTYPWVRFLRKSGFIMAGYSSVLLSIARYYGLLFPLAVMGLAYTVWFFRRREQTAGQLAPMSAKLLLICCLWLAIFGVPFLNSGVGEITYCYVLGVPLVVLAGFLLVRAGNILIIPLLALMLAWQWHAVVQDRNFVWGEDDRRVLAVAAYLNEKRPDLLSERYTALLTRNRGLDPACVGQYARGRMRQLIMTPNFPASRATNRVGANWNAQNSFVESYLKGGVIKASWLLLASEDLEGPSGSFYEQLLHAPQVGYVATFKDATGRKMWLGVVNEGGVSLDQAPVLEVNPWANLYEDRYDRISFLKRNVDVIYRY